MLRTLEFVLPSAHVTEMYMARDVMHEDIISVVEQHPVVWDIECPGYSDRVLRKKVWIDVCILLTPNWNVLTEDQRETRVRDLSVRWRSLRDRYVKELREERQNSLSGSSSKRKRPFPYMEEMGFLRRTMEMRRTTLNVSSPKNFEDASEAGLENEDPDHERKFVITQMVEEPTPEAVVIEQQQQPGPSTLSPSPVTPMPSSSGRGRIRARHSTTTNELESQIVTLLEQIRERQMVPRSPVDLEDMSIGRDADISFLQALLPMLREIKNEWRAEARSHMYSFLTKCLSAQNRGLPFPTVVIYDTSSSSGSSAAYGISASGSFKSEQGDYEQCQRSPPRPTSTQTTYVPPQSLSSTAPPYDSPATDNSPLDYS